MRGAGHQRAGGCQHLLFAARERAADLSAAFLQPWKQGEDALQVLGDRVLVLANEGAHLQVLGHRQPGEDAPAFRHHGHAAIHDLMRLVRSKILAFQDHASFAGLHRLRDRAQRGGLAGAIAADQGDDLALFDGQRDALQGMDIAVIGVDVLNFEHRHGNTLRLGRRGGLPLAEAAGRAPPEIGLDDFGVVLDLRRSPLGDLLAEIQHGDRLRDAHDHAHLVLDEQDGDSQLVAQPMDEVGHGLGLARIHAGGRLVEEQQVRLAGERPGDLQAALIAIGQVLGQQVALPLQTAEPQQPAGLSDGIGLFLHRAPVAQDGADQPRLEVGVHADQDVLHGRHVLEQADVLVGAGDPKPA